MFSWQYNFSFGFFFFFYHRVVLAKPVATIITSKTEILLSASEMCLWTDIVCRSLHCSTSAWEIGVLSPCYELIGTATLDHLISVSCTLKLLRQVWIRKTDGFVQL